MASEELTPTDQVEQAGDGRISIAGHPQARRLVRQARGFAGLAGFLIAGWMSLPTHTLAGTLLSAVIAGLACQIVVWAAAVLLSRPLILAQLREHELALVRAARTRAGGSESTAQAGARPRSPTASRRNQG